MKVEAIKTFAGGIGPSRSWVFVKIYTDNDLVGVGEVTGMGKEEAVRAFIHSPDVEGYLIGRDPLRIEEHHQVITAGSERWRGGAIPGSALAGVDAALWDIAGQACQAPVHRLLGGPVRSKVKVYGHLSGNTPSEYVALAKLRLEQGFSAIKFPPLGPLREPWPPEREAIDSAVRAVQAVREAVGDRADILIEGHGRMEPRMAIRLGQALEPFHPYFYEEPVPYEDVEAMTKVARNVKIPLAGGEHMFHRSMFRPYLERQVIQVLQPDLTKAGGLTECKKIGDLAAVWFAELIPHNSGGPISTCMALQLAAVLPNLTMLELSADEVALWNTFLDEPLNFKDGYVEIPTGPGVGRKIREDMLEAVPFRAVSSGVQWRFG